MDKKLERRLLVIFTVLFACIILGRGIEDSMNRNYNDYYSYLKGGRALRTGQALYFDQEEPSFKYSPFFALIMAPLTLLSDQISYLCWIVVMGIQLFFIFRWSRLIIDQDLGEHRSPPSLYLYVPVLLLAVNFTVSNFDKGQANIFVLFWVTLTWVLLEKKLPSLAGLSLAVGILSKMSPVILLPFLFWRKRYACLFWCALSLIILSLLPWFIQGADKGLHTLIDWFRWTAAAHGPKYVASQPNQSLRGAIYRLFVERSTPEMVREGNGELRISLTAIKWMYYILASLLYAAFLKKPSVLLGQSPYRLKAEGIDFAGILLVSTIIFPLGWRYAFVALLLPVMTVLLYLFRVNWKDRWIVFLLVVFAVTGTALPTIPDDFVRVQVHFYSSVTWGSLVLAAALWKIKHHPLQLAITPGYGISKN